MRALGRVHMWMPPAGKDFLGVVTTPRSTCIVQNKIAPLLGNHENGGLGVP